MKKAVLMILSCMIFILSISCSESNTDITDTLFGLKKTGSMELSYAKCFTADFYDEGYSLVTIGEQKILIVPKDKPVPEGTEGYTVIQQPVENIYAASSSSVDLFDGIGALDSVTMTSTDIKDWALPDVINALENEKMTYIGKYRSPDFECLLENECGLALENTMIYHSPETYEKIEELGIPVIVENSSYEEHPLGRMEWIKLYGLILDKLDTAESFFDAKKEIFDKAADAVSDGDKKTAAFFYVSSSGAINIRKPNDYISKMIELAGGKYIFDAESLNIPETAVSTMNIQLESFYKAAKDADILIYNSTVDGELDSISDLIEKNSIFADLKAVKEGNVWCTRQNVFQQTTGAAEMMTDLHSIINGDTDKELNFLNRLN